MPARVNCGSVSTIEGHRGPVSGVAWVERDTLYRYEVCVCGCECERRERERELV